MAAETTELRVNLDNPVMQRLEALCLLNGWDRKQAITYLVAEHTNRLSAKATLWARMCGANPVPLEAAPPSTDWANL